MKINSNGKIESEIDEVIKVNPGLSVKAVEGVSCRNCFFNNIGCLLFPITCVDRDDETQIYFVEVKND